MILCAIPRLDRSTVELQELPGPTLFSACDMILVVVFVVVIVVIIVISIELQELPHLLPSADFLSYRYLRGVGACW